MKTHDNNYDHVLKYAWLFSSVQGIIIVIGLVRNKAMALLLGVSGMGFASLMNSMQGFASQCTNLGLSFGAVPRLSGYYEQQNQRQMDYYIMVIRLWSVIAAVLGMLFCLVMSPFVDRWSFTWGNHTLHYAMLGLSVAMLALTGGETAILKATRRLGTLARIQIYTAVAAVLLSVPLYYFLGHSGVVPAILLIAFVSMLTTMTYSYRSYPLRIVFRKSLLRDGLSMVRLGMAFVLSAAVGSGSEMLIRSFLNVEGSMDDVGLYNAAFMITITYAGMVFSAMETDYFPRLSAVSKDVRLTNDTVNKQLEVSMLLLSPMLVALMMFLPVLIPLLFSAEFLPVVAMAQVAVLAMYFKVVNMPIAYITLARSYPLSYLFLEMSYFIVLVAGVVLGFRWWGIWGTGVALVVAHVVELAIVYSYAYWRYRYRGVGSIFGSWLLQLAIGIVAYAVTLLLDGWLYWTTEAALALVSTAYSLYVLRQKTHLWQALRRKFRI